MRIFSNVLINYGYSVLDINSFAETALILNKEKDIKAAILSVDDEDDENFKLIKFVKSSPNVKGIPIMVITNNYASDFRDSVVGAGARIILQRMTLTPVKLLDRLKKIIK